MDAITADKKVIIIALSCALLVILDAVFILRPLINRATDLRAQIISVKKNMADLGREINSISATATRLADLKLQTAECEKKFPKDEEIPSLLENISATAAKSGVSIIAIRPVKASPQMEAQKSPDLFHEIPIEIVAKGGYHQLGQFINRLETSARFMEVKDIGISRDPANPRRHDLQLLVMTYILRT